MKLQKCSLPSDNVQNTRTITLVFGVWSYGPMNMVNSDFSYLLMSDSDFCNSYLFITLTNCTYQYSKKGRHLFSSGKQIIVIK